MLILANDKLGYRRRPKFDRLTEIKKTRPDGDLQYKIPTGKERSNLKTFLMILPYVRSAIEFNLGTDRRFGDLRIWALCRVGLAISYRDIPLLINFSKQT